MKTKSPYGKYGPATIYDRESAQIARLSINKRIKGKSLTDKLVDFLEFGIVRPIYQYLQRK